MSKNFNYPKSTKGSRLARKAREKANKLTPKQRQELQLKSKRITNLSPAHIQLFKLFMVVVENLDYSKSSHPEVFQTLMDSGKLIEDHLEFKEFDDVVEFMRELGYYE